MTRYTFEEVKIKATRYWKENGKRRQETKTFYQTINPFNKNAKGQMKTREEIYKELCERKVTWLKEHEDTNG